MTGLFHNVTGGWRAWRAFWSMPLPGFEYPADLLRR
jgi:hypothetical protein